MYLGILDTQSRFQGYTTICVGDFNTCIATVDSINRNKNQNEIILADVIMNNNEVADLVDAYRTKHSNNGFTWKRGEIYSRLDYIFVSRSISTNITCATNNWAFERSDHAAVIITLTFQSEKCKGPGIVKVNVNILKDPFVSKQVGEEIEKMMNQASEEWNPHQRLEFLKVAIRTVFGEKTCQVRRELNEELKESEMSVHHMEELKIRIIQNKNISEIIRKEKCDRIDKGILQQRSELDTLRKKINDNLKFESAAKWFEHGEKSNKFFLNLNKKIQPQKIITNIRNEDKEFNSQKEVIEGITEFYKDLYEEKVKNPSEDKKFYEHCPKISEEHCRMMESKMEINELKAALMTCEDSSPGPDGIPYSVYKKYWNFMGPIITEAWNYSTEKQNLPSSNRESVITLLPKEGKNLNEIKNWRPITLSNCDSKLVTKALSNRVSKTLESIMDPSQTAYVRGRSVMDNLRANFYYKEQCKKKNTNAALISLDAKKAFDSVDHQYIEETLIAYGFGPSFVNVFKTLYGDITARIMVNGFMSESIRIGRGVKQGDALSCALFIICIDPILRNINNNKKIEEINKNGFKCAAYADDISIICKNNLKSIQQVFEEYSRLTMRSGLELNADKTEILILNNGRVEEMNIVYNNENITIKTVSKLKICGLWFCADSIDEYRQNVREKIMKMESQLKMWSKRHLTMEGKILIVKTFGLSQMIYGMQGYGIKQEELIQTERIIFQFIWSSNENKKGIDRIKRSIMKNEYIHGGLNVTDVDSLDRSLKLRQFIRSFSTSHPIKKVQAEITGCAFVSKEYEKITKDEPICARAQDTINKMTDYERSNYRFDDKEENSEHYKIIAINNAASVDLVTFLKRSNRLFHVCVANQLTKDGITTLGELMQEYEFEIDKKRIKIMKIILAAIPENLKKAAEQYNENKNEINQQMTVIELNDKTHKNVTEITTKELQARLKIVLGKTEVLAVEKRLNLEKYDVSNIIRFRKSCKNTKLRNIFFRLIHKDFFTQVRMKKFRMTDSDKCNRCGEVETIQHLLIECVHSKNIWLLYNEIMLNSKIRDEFVLKYDDIFEVGKFQSSILLKIRVIQELIQIERPKNWSIENIKEIIRKLISYDKYNNNVMADEKKISIKWKNFNID